MSGPAMHTEYGNRDVAMSGEILRTVVGSGVHGIAIEGTDDHDEMGVFVEPPQHVLGVDRPHDHYVFRTQPEGARDGRLTLPMPSPERERVLRVKRGDIRDLGGVLAEIAAVAAQMQELLDTGRTPLRAEPDLDVIGPWTVQAHRRHWAWT